MIELGKFLLMLGVGSFALHFLNMEFRLLLWIDTWGIEIGHAIRGGIALSGLAILLLAYRLSTSENEDHSTNGQQTSEEPVQA